MHFVSNFPIHPSSADNIRVAAWCFILLHYLTSSFLVQVVASRDWKKKRVNKGACCVFGVYLYGLTKEGHTCTPMHADEKWASNHGAFYFHLTC